MSTQSDDEIWIMNMFLEVHPKNDIKLLSKQESPDFIVELEGNKIGVELTEIFQDSKEIHER